MAEGLPPELLAMLASDEPDLPAVALMVTNVLDGERDLVGRGRVVVALAEGIRSPSMPDAQARVYDALVDLVTHPEFRLLDRVLQMELAVSVAYYGDLLGDLDRLERWSRLCIDVADGDIELCESPVLTLAEDYVFAGRADEARELLDMVDRDRTPDLTFAIWLATLRQALGDEVPNLDDLVAAVDRLDPSTGRGAISAVSQLCTVVGRDVDALRLLQRAMDGPQAGRFWSDVAVNEICMARIARRYDRETARWHTRRALLAVARNHVEAASPPLRAQRLQADRGVVSSAFDLAASLDVAIEAVTAAESLASEGLTDVLAKGGLPPSPTAVALATHVDDVFTEAWAGGLPELTRLFPLRDELNALYFVPVEYPGIEPGGYRVSVVGDEADVSRFHLSVRSRRILAAGPTERLGLLSSDLSALSDDLFAGVKHPPPGERLVVVPQNILWSVPWHLLPVDDQLLGDRHLLDVTPSIGLWQALRPPPRVAKAVLLRGPDAPGSAAESRALRAAPFETHETTTIEEALKLLGDAQLLVISCEAAMTSGGLQLALGGRQVGPEWLSGVPVPAIVVVTACDAALGTERSEPAALPSVLLGSGASWVLAPTTKLHGHLAVDLLSPFYAALGTGTSPSAALAQVMADTQISLHARLSPLLAVGRGG